MKKNKIPTLYLVIPCYNEEQVLPITSKIFKNKLFELINNKKISSKSKMLLVNDGSKDSTWNIICNLSKRNECIEGISLSRNRGHQNALLAGLMEAKEFSDITISLDCDGQDDINAVNEMVDKYNHGYEIVYGVRSNRDSDTFFKKRSAELFYRLLNTLGGEIVFNHADYRLVSSKVLKEFSNFGEVNMFLRGMFPLVGFKSTNVYYERHERLAGESKYPLSKMIELAFNGITSLSIKPIRIITGFGCTVSLISFVCIVYIVICKLINNAQTVQGWASMTCIICFISGIQLISLGVIGEYVGKTYMETKHRPRYIISEKTY